MSFSSITQRFVLWFLLISLLPILLISYSLLHTFETELKQSVSRQISVIADKKMDQIASYLDGRVHDALVKTQANSTRLAMSEFALAFSRNGIESEVYRRLESTYREHFRRFVTMSGYYDLFLISPQGTVVYSQAREADLATNLFTGPYRNTGLAKVTRNALRTLESDISEFERYAPSGNAVAAFVAVPIVIEGKVAGVLALQIDNARVLETLLDRTGMGDSGETVVVSRGNESGAVEMVPLKLQADTSKLHQARINSVQPGAALLRALNGERGNGFMTDYLGQPVVAAWRYLPHMRWGMVVKMNTAEALAPYYRVRNFGLAVLVLAFFAALLGAILLGRRVVMPLTKLTVGAQEIASGKLEQRVPVVGRDELGRLAESFNSMTERLQASYANLEDQVRQRTAELTRVLQQEQATQAELQHSEMRLNEAQRVAQVGSWELDLLTGELNWSDEIFRLFEIDKSQFGATYEAFLNGIHPDDRDAVNRAYTRSLETRTPYEISHRLRMSDGRIKWVNERCHTRFDAEGKALRSLGTVQDISVRKNVEQALEKSESLFRTLAELAPVGIFRADAAGACTYVNAQYCEISGVSPEAAMGSGWSAFIHPDDIARVFAEWDAAVKNQEAIVVEYRYLHPDGKVLWAAGQTRAETDAAGMVLGYVGTVTDISERKQAEAVLKNSNEELERRVENRTALLRAAKEEAERANNSKSLFLTSMSHELRTPLNAILGYAQLMQIDDRLPQEVLDNANEIKQAGDFLLHMLNDILDLSRIESGKLQFKFEAVKMSDVMKDCHAHNIQTAMSHNVALHLDESCSIYQVAADKRGLTQVLNNLVSNAIKYNRDGGQVKVSCSALEAAAGGQAKVRVSVADSGPGIATDKQAQLFQPFNRLGAEMGTIEGTGIGLVISRKLIQGMQGEIGVDSIEGLGSTFWVELPLANRQIASSSLSPSNLMPAAGGALRKAPRVLVAEDYVPNQNVLLLQLQTMGCEVDIAANGADALKMWRTNPYDLILTDMDMPVMSGTEFALALRNEERSRGGRIPIIAITATSTGSDLKRYQSAGIDEVLGKPLSLDMLRNGMLRWLEKVEEKQLPAAIQGAGDATEKHAAAAVLDLNYLYHILGQVNLVQARVLVDTFMRTADEGLILLQSQTGNAAVVAKEMHKQKSSAKTVGALRYASLAAALEQRSKDEHFAGMASSLAELREALDEVEAASANLLESPRVRPAEPATAHNIAHLIAHSVLVVDDDLVVLQQVKTMLGALGMREVITAINGLEASKVLAERGSEIEVLVCDLSMPLMDGVELIRQVGRTGFKGGLILISGADEKIISTVNKLAVLQGVRVLGQLQKPVSAAQLASLLAHAADLPALQRQAASGPVVSKEAIKAAMIAQEFSVWFQPKVDALSLQAVGIEALARWQLPDGKFIPPDSFITVAERDGLIGELSRLLVSISLSEAAKLFAAGFPLKVAINLSGTWLNDLNLPDFILSNTLAAGLRATDVILEVTETGVMEDLTTALDVLSRLRLKGFGLSIDDFGIGYSSFEQLGRIPFTEMKLDRSFVNKGVEDAAARAILESSMDMAHKLSLSTVAEGVETELDLKLVRSLGCDLVQGYLIAKPMPVTDLIVWLDNAKHQPKKK